MLRAGAIATVLLLLAVALPVEAGPAGSMSFITGRWPTEAGWAVERINVTGPRILVSLSSSSTADVMAHTVALYDGSARLITGVTYFMEGGRHVDGTVTMGNVTINTDANPLTRRAEPLTQLNFYCDATCNPGGVFNVVIAVGGKVDHWSYGIYGVNGTAIANTTGTEAYALTSREFQGNVVHARFNERTGVTSVADGAYSMRVDDKLVGSYAKFAGERPQTMTIAGPTGTKSCKTGCVFYNTTAWGAGDYTVRYTDTDKTGEVAYLAWADVRFP